MNKILKIVCRDIQLLREYLMGKRIRSLSLSDLNLYQCIISNEVPGYWLHEGFFTKINVTLVEWLELLTAKHAFLERWVIESKGTPPTILKAATLMNPFNLLH